MKKTKELTPVKAVLIYSIAMALVVFYNLPRVLSWVEETRSSIASGEIFDGFASNSLRYISMASSRFERSDQGPNTESEGVGAKSLEVQEGTGAKSLETAKDEAGPKGPEAPQDEAGPKEPEAPQEAVCGPVPAQDDAGQAAATPPGDSNGAADTERAAAENAPTESVPAESAPQTEKSETSSPGTPTPKLKPHKVLLVGDSMIAEGFGPALQRRLRAYTSLKVIRKGQYSTGFVHQEDFNWAEALKEFIEQYEPDLIVIHMGTNDPIDIMDDSGKRIYCGNDRWREVYASRVREFLNVAAKRKILSFWVGLPIMSSDKYCAKISVINSIVERECSKVSGCVYVDSWSALADAGGNYSAFIREPGGKQKRIRAKDNVHLTEAGGAILADYFLRTACGYVDLAVSEEKKPDGLSQ